MHAHILIVAGSTRSVRRSPAIAAWVEAVGREATPLDFQTVELNALGLTLDDEPGLPALDGYTQATTRAWSRRVAEAAGVVFVAPQYNWGYPAGLKNAIDHLYAEWKGKPGLIVTYGGHGGGKCADQLRQVLGALGMRLAEAMPGLKLSRAQIEADDGQVDPPVDFAAHRDEVTAAIRELADLVEAPPAQ